MCFKDKTINLCFEQRDVVKDGYFSVDLVINSDLGGLAVLTVMAYFLVSRVVLLGHFFGSSKMLLTTALMRPGKSSGVDWIGQSCPALTSR
jgi:hypothetical protein